MADGLRTLEVPNGREWHIWVAKDINVGGAMANSKGEHTLELSRRKEEDFHGLFEQVGTVRVREVGDDACAFGLLGADIHGLTRKRRRGTTLLR